MAKKRGCMYEEKFDSFGYKLEIDGTPLEQRMLAEEITAKVNTQSA